MKFVRVRWPDRASCRHVDQEILDLIVGTADHAGEGIKIALDPNDTWHKVYNRYRKAVQSRGYNFEGLTAQDGGLIMRARKRS